MSAIKQMMFLFEEYVRTKGSDDFLMSIEDPGLLHLFKSDVDRRNSRVAALDTMIQMHEDSLIGRQQQILESPQKPVNKKPKISGAIMCKNEEESIERCLLSIYDVCDEIVIMDTGSTDDTMEIVKQYPKVKLIEKSIPVWDFSVARNLSFSLCSGEWILMIDADESLCSNQKELRAFIHKSDKKTVHSLSRYNIKNNDMEIMVNIPRIFPKGSVEWKYAVHHEPFLTSEKYTCSGDNDFMLLHWMPEGSRKEALRSDRNNEFIQKEALEDPNFRSCHLLLRLYMMEHDAENAAKIAVEGYNYYRLMPTETQIANTDFLITATRALFYSGHIQEVIDLKMLDRYYFLQDRKTADLCFYSHVLASKFGDHRWASEWLNEYLNLVEFEKTEPFTIFETLQYHDHCMLKNDIYMYWLDNMGELS
jgi:glycosyltransferase involved in cell wall biosynthesis